MTPQLPAAFSAADTASVKAQAKYRRTIGISIALLVVASTGGAVNEQWAGCVSAIAFAASLLLTALRTTRSAQRSWYDGRAAAESAKTIAWKYAVGGEPFGIGEKSAAERYRSALESVRTELARLDSSLDAEGASAAATSLRELRAESLDVRKARYLEDRLEDQQTWYARRADEFRSSASLWRGVTIFFQLVGVGGAVLKGIGVTEVDLLGLAATAAAAALAWRQLDDDEQTARGYEFAAIELSDQASLVDAVEGEAAWASFVADAEAAISREHTVWVARRR